VHYHELKKDTLNNWHWFWKKTRSYFFCTKVWNLDRTDPSRSRSPVALSHSHHAPSSPRPLPSRVATAPSVPAPDADLYRLYVQRAPLPRFRSRRPHRSVLVIRLGSSLLPPSTWPISSLPPAYFVAVRPGLPFGLAVLAGRNLQVNNLCCPNPLIASPCAAISWLLCASSGWFISNSSCIFDLDPQILSCLGRWHAGSSFTLFKNHGLRSSAVDWLHSRLGTA
jgi:hypothetical protein